VDTTLINLNQSVEKICFLNYYLSPPNLLKIQEFNLTRDQEVKLINEVFNRMGIHKNAKQHIEHLTKSNAVEFVFKDVSNGSKSKSLNLNSEKLKFLKILITHPMWENVSGHIDFLNLNLETTHEAIQLSQKIDQCFDYLVNSNNGLFTAKEVISSFYSS